jgi:hypothetical protein
MRSAPDLKLEAGRVRDGGFASYPGDLHGAFDIMGPAGAKLSILSSGVDSEYAWEHVSVSVDHRTPNWREMCWVKDLFWGDGECVVQYHPPRAEYVNCHPNCLHLWRPLKDVMPMPPAILVGPKKEPPR